MSEILIDIIAAITALIVIACCVLLAWAPIALLLWLFVYHRG